MRRDAVFVLPALVGRWFGVTLPTPVTAQPLPPGLREATAFFDFLSRLDGVSASGSSDMDEALGFLTELDGRLDQIAGNTDRVPKQTT